MCRSLFLATTVVSSASQALSLQVVPSRCCRIAVAGIVAAVVWACWPSQAAVAGCGDYVLVTGGGHFSGELYHVQPTAPDRQQRLPCQGPSCSRGPDHQTPSAPAGPQTAKEWALAVAAADEPLAHPQAWEPIIRPPSCRLACRGIFRPPRNTPPVRVACT